MRNIIDMSVAIVITITAIVILTLPENSHADCNERIITIQYGNPGPGYETTPDPQEAEDPGLPDFTGKKTVLADINRNEKYKFLKTDEIKMRAKFKNAGDNDVDSDADIPVRYYLSKGYKEDSHDKWLRVGKDNIKGRNLDPGESHWEEEGLKLSDERFKDYIKEGKFYNIVACIDRTKDQHTGYGKYREIHESNNCTTEAVFEVVAPNQPPEGWLDEANCNQIRGWARDPNTTSPISVHLYADGEAGMGTFIGATPADQLRPDLPFDDKHHGFTFRTPESLKDGHIHYIYAYGIDDQGGTNPLLNGNPKSVNHCVSAAVMQVLMNYIMED